MVQKLVIFAQRSRANAENEDLPGVSESDLRINIIQDPLPPPKKKKFTSALVPTGASAVLGHLLYTLVFFKSDVPAGVQHAVRGGARWLQPPDGGLPQTKAI